MPSASVKVLGRLLVLSVFSDFLWLPMYHVTLLVRPPLLRLVLIYILPALRKYCFILMPIADPPMRLPLSPHHHQKEQVVFV